MTTTWKAPLIVALSMFAFAATEIQAGESFKTLVFSKTLLYRHSSITNGVAMLQTLGQKNGFSVDATEDSTAFTPQNLSTYKVVIFLSTSGDVLNAEQQSAFKNFVEGGGGFVGIHAAVAGAMATEGDWPWYAEVFCAEFHNHKSIERATVLIEDHANASVAHFSGQWSRTDEWYNFVATPRAKVHVIASLDEKSFHGGTMGDDHPVVWCRTVGKGRLWYTALGHTEESYTEREFIQHVLGGIEIAAGLKPSKFAAKK
jgi:type 1 glutamine amidotransferase